MRKTTRNPALDLFGEVVVTEDDLFNWVQAVAPLYLTPERSYRNYVRSYDVASKVRYAKLAGTFCAIIDKPRRPWHARIALSQIL